MDASSEMSGASSSSASFSIVSNPSQKCWIGGALSLAGGLLRFSEDNAFLFSPDDALPPPSRFCPWGGEFASNFVKSGSSVRALATPLPLPCLVIFFTRNMVLVKCARLGVPYGGFGHAWSLHIFVMISMHIGKHGVLIFSMGGVILVLLSTFLFSYTRVYGLCRGRSSDLLVFMSLL